MVTTLARVFAILLGTGLLIGAEPTPTNGLVGMWDVVESPQWALTVRSIERLREPLRTSDNGVYRATGQFAIVVSDLTNRTDRPLTIPPDAFELWSETGERFANVSDGSEARGYAEINEMSDVGASVRPGETVTTPLVFDVDPAAQRLILIFVPARENPIRLEECHCSLPSPADRSVGGNV